MPTLSSLDPHTPRDRAWGLRALQTAAGWSGRMWGSGALQGRGRPQPGAGHHPRPTEQGWQGWQSPSCLLVLTQHECAGLCQREGSGGVADLEEDPSEGRGGGTWKGSEGGVERGRQTLTGR